MNRSFFFLLTQQLFSGRRTEASSGYMLNAISLFFVSIINIKILLHLLTSVLFCSMRFEMKFPKGQYFIISLKLPRMVVIKYEEFICCSTNNCLLNSIVQIYQQNEVQLVAQKTLSLCTTFLLKKVRLHLEVIKQ